LRASATFALRGPVLFAIASAQSRSPDPDVVGHQRVRGLIEAGSRHPVAALGDAAVLARLAGLVALRRQAEIGADAGGTREPRSVVESGRDGERGDRSDAWRRHEQADDAALAGGRTQLGVEHSDAVQDGAPRRDQPLEEPGAAPGNGEFLGDDLFGPAHEAADALAEHDAEGLEQAADPSSVKLASARTAKAAGPAALTASLAYASGDHAITLTGVGVGGRDLRGGLRRSACGRSGQHEGEIIAHRCEVSRVM